MINFLVYLWQLPQHIVAKILLLVLKNKISGIALHKTSIIYYINNISWGGVSLGQYIFIDSNRKKDRYIQDHEYGHSVQSLRWGWLYLIAVGIPSATMNKLSFFLYNKGYPKMITSYYDRWPENEADKLGKVNRV